MIVLEQAPFTHTKGPLPTRRTLNVEPPLKDVENPPSLLPDVIPCL